MSFFVTKPGSTNPIRAVVASWFLVQLVLFVGQINVIAPIVSMLFLLCYGVVNLACFVQRVQASPNFRPTFRYFSWHTALFGAIACVAVMFFVQPMYAAASFLLMMLLFIFLNYRSTPANWGEVSQALIYHQVRKYLLRLKDSTISVKYWRPQILMLVTNPRKQYQAIGMMNEIKKGGLFVLGHILVQPFSRNAIHEVKSTKDAWLTLAGLEKWKAFVDIIVSNSVRDGVRSLLASCGLGGMRPNILVLNFIRDTTPSDQLLDRMAAQAEKASRSTWIPHISSSDVDHYSAVTDAFPPIHNLDNEHRSPPLLETEFVGIVRDALLMGKSIIMTRNFAKLESRLQEASGRFHHYIDLYPVVRPGPARSLTFDFILQMATILHMVGRWRNHRIRVFAIVDPGTDIDAEETRLQGVLEDVRIMHAEVKMITYVPQKGEGKSFFNASTREQFSFVNRTILTNSTKTSAVFSYLPSPPERPPEAYRTDDDDDDDDDNDSVRGGRRHHHHHQHASTPTARDHLQRIRDYLEDIDVLTRDTPPICLFHGVEPVVTPNASSV
ncbi:hypothetical protein PTSG_05157 [Salpingoeca rosetta]|uniref:Amino acid permease/ SLC12A domain-containing protein n=1 Tax=Salpingoeca rosetta (strain ATCC 50818 / BSB-021) TaxID=946362 RepID=F2UAN8_SALR5|nr:uncharacterized protein PTSG_05157 [Salpingoeca rosetta]EGD73454.1 hypothetical protein PTSG_05157 [Salpingoeca rosetta]|eukprot:XP_004993736.1 hypothetical protein PTSG_05157 [Salpingoeca rosetta]